MIELTDQPIDYTAVTESVRDRRAGAVVLFLGTVREITGDTTTRGLDYDAYRQMAESKMRELHDECARRFATVCCSLVHRTGSLQPGDVCVAIAVSAPHRPEAFDAGRWLIDTLKERVPIWKKEFYGDGTVDWVHPDGSETAEVHG